MPAVAATLSQNTSTSCASNPPIVGTGNSTAHTQADRPPRSTATVASDSSIGMIAWP